MLYPFSYTRNPPAPRYTALGIRLVLPPAALLNGVLLYVAGRHDLAGLALVAALLSAAAAWKHWRDLCTAYQANVTDDIPRQQSAAYWIDVKREDILTSLAQGACLTHVAQVHSTRRTSIRPSEVEAAINEWLEWAEKDRGGLPLLTVAGVEGVQAKAIALLRYDLDRFFRNRMGAAQPAA